MKVAVIGTGYVGLTTGAALAYLGHEVACVDMDEDKINRLLHGFLPFYEPLLDQIISTAQQRLTFTTSYEEGVCEADIIFIAVGTPANADGSPNLSHLYSAVEQMMVHLHQKATPTVIVNKSTVPVGTADQICEKIRGAGLESLVTIASNPEFLRQGRAVHDTLYPDRIIVGGDDAAALALEQLYSDIIVQQFTEPDGARRPAELHKVPYLAVDRRSAELSKYAANAFLAMKISFINEIANVCDRVGANVIHVADIIGMDPRIGPSFLQAGIGFGGSCFPKDTRALQYIADTNGYDFKLLSAVIDVNNAQKYRIVEKARNELNGLQGKKIAILGLAFKPQTDDLREAPSIPIIEMLLSEGAEVHVHDPVALEKARSLLPSSVHFQNELYEVLYQADAAMLVTEWPEYLAIEAEYLQSVMRTPLLIDGRNALGKVSGNGVVYRGIGTGVG